MMQKTISALVFVGLTLTAAPASAQSWGPTVKERLAWAEVRTKQLCPYGVNVSKDDAAQKERIGGRFVLPIMVEAYIRSICRSPQKASR